ncbi:MAG: STAS domain-containing protein [Gammaproteobacteria bacterium]|nr:STAS domain-containing protein [Gammaproteobacteria bacterium]MDH5776909.1 STAS domain-containing protein [Gammaproteobacteria bacterium]
MSFEIENENGKCKVKGELTIYTANKFKDEIQKCVEGSDQIELDLSAVDEIDTSCFQLLMQAKKACDKSDKEFVLSKISPMVQDVMHLYSLDQFFEPQTRHV